MRNAQIFIVSAPSGAGKTSLIKALLKRMPSVALSVSYTTRPKRPNEIMGQHYHFVTVEAFQAMQRRQEFVESACVHQNYYGTSKVWLMKTLSQGKDVLIEIDWQGAQQIKQHFPNAVSIFILPPSLAALQQRLQDRATDTPETIEKRLLAATHEIEHMPEYEYAIINDDFDAAVSDLHCVLKATRLSSKVIPPDFLGIKMKSAIPTL